MESSLRHLNYVCTKAFNRIWVCARYIYRCNIGNIAISPSAFFSYDIFLLKNKFSQEVIKGFQIQLIMNRYCDQQSCLRKAALLLMLNFVLPSLRPPSTTTASEPEGNLSLRTNKYLPITVFINSNIPYVYINYLVLYRYSFGPLK